MLLTVADGLDGDVETLASSAVPLASAAIQKSMPPIIKLVPRIFNTVALKSHAYRKGIRL